VFELGAVNDVAKGEEIRDIVFEDEPRFTFFKFIHDYKTSEITSISPPPNGLPSNIVFIYSCPGTSSVKQRMVYASSRSAILALAANLGVTVDVKIETSEVDELSIRYLTREVHGDQVVEERKSFARPRGPPRRTQKVSLHVATEPLPTETVQAETVSTESVAAESVAAEPVPADDQ
jgi:Cofilin/tropomyosin-type actin-binding protein